VSCPHAHQQNGSAEQKYLHIVEVGLTLLAQAFMPLKFWDETFTIAIYLINHTRSKVINHETPLERYSTPNRTTSPYVPLGVHVGLILAPTTNSRSNLDQNNVFSSGIATNTRDSSVLMLV
jgi:hypothetical protein